MRISMISFFNMAGNHFHGKQMVDMEIKEMDKEKSMQIYRKFGIIKIVLKKIGYFKREVK